MAASTLNLTELDFDGIKSNLKAFLQNQSQFRDVNFDSPNISVLIDLLAYNTYMNAFYLNMSASEGFNDSAQLRDSVISHAKELNYVPRSFRSAAATISLTIDTANAQIHSLFVPKGTSFTTQVGANTFTYSVANNIVLTSANGVFSSNSVTLYEGAYITDSFVYDLSREEIIGEQQRQRFVLSNPQIDLTSLEVQVIEDGGATTLDYVKKDQLLDVKADTKAYFIQAVENNQYEIYFGTGIIGRRPKNGSIVVANYRISSGELSNGADTFTSDGPIDGHSDVTTEIVSAAAGGAIYEDTESIRFNAPRYFQTRGRAITRDDYKTILTVEFPEIDAINVYGGEEMDPPQYGKVFISVNRDNASFVSDERKRVYIDFLRKRTSLAIDPEFIDPDFLFVKIDSSVKYNINASVKNSEDIRSLVLSAVSEFNDSQIDDYEVTLRASKLYKAIDDADSSILSNDTQIRLYKLLVPDVTLEDFSTTLYFDNAIRSDLSGNEWNAPRNQHAVESTIFVSEGSNVYLEDNSQGSLQMIQIVGDERTVVDSDVGTVDYETGIVSISKIKVDSFSGNGIKLYVRPATSDVQVRKNNILTIVDSDITVSVTGERA